MGGGGDLFIPNSAFKKKHRLQNSPYFCVFKYALNAWNKLKYGKYGKIKDIKYVFQKIFLIFWIERQTFLGDEKLKIIERFRITFLTANGRR